MGFVSLKDWSKRTNPEQDVNAIVGRLVQHFSQNQDGMVLAFNLPPIIELGQATGFDFFLEDRGGLGHEKLMQARNLLLQKPRKTLCYRRYDQMAWMIHRNFISI